MAAPAKKEPKKKDPELDEDLDLEEEEEEEEENHAKKKPTSKKEEDMPAWAKQIIKLLTPQEQPPEAKIIPAPKPPARAKRGRGRPRKNAGGEPAATAGSEAVTNVPRLVLVDDPNEEPTEDPEAAATPAAPKNPSKRKRKEIQFEFKKEQLSILIKTTFDIIGSREGMEMWKLSQKEADLLADPMCALMAKNPMIDRITSEYGEWIALIVALGTVIAAARFCHVGSQTR